MVSDEYILDRGITFLPYGTVGIFVDNFKIRYTNNISSVAFPDLDMGPEVKL